MTSKKDSIYFQLSVLLFVSAFVSVLLFGGLNYAGSYMIDAYYYNSDYEQKKDEGYAKELQEFISDENLSSADTAQLSEWVKEQKILTVWIYKNDILIFDSSNVGQAVWDENIMASDYGWEIYYPLTFSDGEGKASIVGIYAYQFYNYALILELLFSFGVFLTLVLLGIRKKMNYIRQLRDEIEILEGGSLDYRITVKGRDEISVLAEGLEHMRASFQGLIRQEAEMVQENQRIVTEMSHDLRTPVTSIMLYIEILKKGRYDNEEQLKEYLEKIDQKARRMKHLTDHLFEYSLIAGEGEIQMEEPEIYEVLFYDLFSETASYLEHKGFRVLFQIEWMNSLIQISTDYVLRIMDNLTSNIVKYGDPDVPVIISSVRDGNMVGFLFENKIHKMEQKTDSTGIGIQSIRNMMMKMGGKCVAEETGDFFRILLLFPSREQV